MVQRIIDRTATLTLVLNKRLSHQEAEKRLAAERGVLADYLGGFTTISVLHWRQKN